MGAAAHPVRDRWPRLERETALTSEILDGHDWGANTTQKYLTDTTN
ncbi:hypothetical protein [Streptomyces sp. NPDC057854]